MKKNALCASMEVPGLAMNRWLRPGIAGGIGAYGGGITRGAATPQIDSLAEDGSASST